MTAKGQPRFRGFSTDVALDIVQAMDHPGLFKQWFDGPSWGGWRAVLKAAFCLPMSKAERLEPIQVTEVPYELFWGPHRETL